MALLIGKVHSIDCCMQQRKGSHYFVTVGEKHVMYWYMNSDKYSASGSANNVSSVQQEITEQVHEQQGKTNPGSVAVLKGRSGVMSHAYKHETFVDVACGRNERSTSTGGKGDLDTVYCITAKGTLVCFGQSRCMEKWVEMQTQASMGISTTGKFVAVSCVDGVVRLFESGSLAYVTTLPKPPPLGAANVHASPDAKDISIANSIPTPSTDGSQVRSLSPFLS